MDIQKDTATFMETFCRLLQAGETASLPVLGNSMSPFLVHKRDTVWLSAPTRPLKVGDIVLYRRLSGDYILHRICAIQNGIYTLIGDAQAEPEPNIQASQILALVIRVQRKGNVQQPGKFCWEFFAQIWVRLIPLRSVFLRTYAFFSKLFRRSL